MIASVVLAIAVVGVCGVLAAASQQAAAMREQAAAISLARQLMEEIAGKPFRDPTTGSITLGPGPDQTGREHFDSVGDYHGYSDDGFAVRTLAGDTLDLTGGQPYTRQVSVEYRATPSGPAASTGDFALVTVGVTTPSGQTVTLSKLMANVEYQK